MLLAGLWCATVKPPCFSFLEPLCKALSHLETEGIQLNCKYSWINYNSIMANFIELEKFGDIYNVFQQWSDICILV